MATIHILPVRSKSIDESTRLSEELAAARERGQHLGPRALHIQAGGKGLLETGRLLQLAIDDLDQSLIELGMEGQVEDLRRLLSQIHDLASMAQQFQPSA